MPGSAAHPRSQLEPISTTIPAHRDAEVFRPPHALSMKRKRIVAKNDGCDRNNSRQFRGDRLPVAEACLWGDKRLRIYVESDGGCRAKDRRGKTADPSMVDSTVGGAIPRRRRDTSFSTSNFRRAQGCSNPGKRTGRSLWDAEEDLRRADQGCWSWHACRRSRLLMVKGLATLCNCDRTDR